MWFIGAFSFPSCWVLLAIFFAFLRRFSSLGALFVSVLVDFARFFFVFLSVSSKVCLQTCLAICSTASRLRWIRTVLLRLRVVNPPPRLHQFPHHGPPLLRNYRRPLRSPSKRRVCHRPFPKLFSSRSLWCWRLFGRTERQILPAVHLAIPVRLLPRQMCCRLIHQPRLVVARLLQQVASLCRRFFLLIRLMVFPWLFVVPRASQPPVPASSAPS